MECDVTRVSFEEQSQFKFWMDRAEHSAHASLEEIYSFAEAIGLEDQLLKQLEYLATYFDNTEDRQYKCELYTDFAPWSLSFCFYYKKPLADRTWSEWKFAFNGGLIYQSTTNPADGGGPSFTVSLDPTRQGWFVHT